MNTTWRGLLAASAVAVSTPGCGDFLSTDKVATDPNNPSANTGVFDVKSGSDATALDGSKYADW